MQAITWRSLMFMSRAAIVTSGVVVMLLAPAASFERRAQPASAAYADRTLDVNGLRIHYLDWGSAGKQPFVMLHGIARHAHSFDHIAPHFAPSYQVIAMDLRGHGDSGWDPGGAYLVEDYVKDLEALVARLGLRRIVITGNSTGGRVAQVYAGLHPDNVAGLIVEDVGPERPNEIADNFARRVKAEANGWASEAELLATLTSTGSIAEPLQRTHVQYGTKKRADGRVVWKRDPNLVKGFVPTELWKYVSRITAPTLYILGGDSKIVPPETQERLQRTLPRVRIEVMPGIGHYPHLEAPDQFVAMVKGFLSGVETDRYKKKQMIR
jgi:pimeloyl-ACP methyl ester carboxylesterase